MLFEDFRNSSPLEKAGKVVATAFAIGVTGMVLADSPREAAPQPSGMREPVAVQEVTSIHVPGGVILAE